MRSLYIVVLIFVLHNNIGLAQFKVSIEAGSNYTNLQLNPDNKIPHADPAYGYFFGLIPQYDFNSFLSFKMDVQLSSEPYLYNGFFTRKNTFQFLRLSPKLEIWPLDFLSLYGGYNIGNKLFENELKNEVPVVPPTSDFTNPTYDQGISVGFNFYFRSVYFTAKYYHGLEYIDAIFITDSTGTLFVGERIKNRVFQFGLGYRFSLDKIFN